MLPALVSSDDVPIQVLPPGVHWATLGEVEGRFAFSPPRKAAFEQIAIVAYELRSAGCQSIYIGGSFVTDKEAPPLDFKIGWEPSNVRPAKLAPIMLDADRTRRMAHYGGDVFALMSTTECGQVLLEYMQIDPATGERKGILGVVLTSGLH